MPKSEVYTDEAILKKSRCNIRHARELFKCP